MANYVPDLSNSVPLILLKPTSQPIIGILKKNYPSIEESIKDQNNIIFGTFKTYGGTESNINGIYSIIETAIIETWFRPDIKSNCRIALETGEIYEIIGEPENINKRNQFLKFKVKRVKGEV